MSLNRLSILGIAAALGMNIPAIHSRGGHRIVKEAPSRSYYGMVFGYRKGPGWTHAQVKRMAKKKRNQARHKAASR